LNKALGYTTGGPTAPQEIIAAVRELQSLPPAAAGFDSSPVVPAEDDPDVRVVDARDRAWSLVDRCDNGIGHKWMRDLDGDDDDYMCEHCPALGVPAHAGGEEQ
jgi:hypothetical protein